ncbi:MAG: valine--pyruvate transaminase [Verrucomicrobiales bacterium]
MKFPLSCSGLKLASRSGIVELMDDLGEAMSGDAGEMCMMGGGNPAAIAQIQEVWRTRLAELLESGECDSMLGNYDGPAGNPAFRKAFAAALRDHFGWKIDQGNIAVTNGGQSAFFSLFNMLAGEFPDGSRRRIVIPLVPEYIGYENQGVRESLFATFRPKIHLLDNREFKYEVDFEHLAIGVGTAAICVSRPTNPTGNVLTDEEIAHLLDLARAHSIPLIVDSAYGAPFPNAIFTEINPVWNEDVILTFSLSKLGLPGTRTGIVLAHESVIERISALTSVIGLANNNVGQAITRPLLENGELIRLSREVIRPFYRGKSVRALAWLHQIFAERFPYRVHRSEGAFFLWVWFPDLPITTRELYQRLKSAGVLVIPGEYFFYGLEEHWPHSRQCIRLTFSQPGETVRRGLEIIADEVEKLG